MTDSIQKGNNDRKDNRDPLYLQVKKKLIKAIDRMDIGKNKLPNEMKLAEMMGVSRSTLREAINSLVLDKIIAKTNKGMVAFPSVNRLDYRMENYADFRDMLAKSGKVRIEGTEPRLAEPSERMLKRMPEAEGHQVYTWVREHYLNDQLVIYADYEIPLEHFTKSSEGLNEMRFRSYLKEYVTEDIAYHISWIKSRRYPELAEMFNCEDDIIECWDQVFKDHGDRSICYCQVSFHPDIIDLSIVINHR